MDTPSSVGKIKLYSEVEAEESNPVSGIPFLSVASIIFVPLPFFVGPTADPPFLQEQMSRLQIQYQTQAFLPWKAEKSTLSISFPMSHLLPSSLVSSRQFRMIHTL